MKRLVSTLWNIGGMLLWSVVPMLLLVSCGGVLCGGPPDQMTAAA